MKILLGLLWMLYAVMQAHTGVVPDKLLKQEREAYTSQQQSSYQTQNAAYNRNQNYDSRVQRSGENIFRNTAVQNPQTNIATSSAGAHQIPTNQQIQSGQRIQQNPMQVNLSPETRQSYANHQRELYPQVQHTSINSQLPSYSGNQQSVVQQQPFSVGQRSRATAYNVQNIPNQNEPILYQSQYDLSSNATFREQPTDIRQVQQQALLQNVPRYDQNSYSQTSSNPRLGVNHYQNQKLEQNKETAEDVKTNYQYPALDVVDSKTNTARKIPLVLITIQKNKNVLNSSKSKTNIKQKNVDSDKEKSPQVAYSNVAVNSYKDLSGKTSNFGTSLNGFQGQYSGSQPAQQNKVKVSSLSNEQNYPQRQLHLPAEQSSQDNRDQRSNFQVSQYRYPVLTGKKQESSEWKPVERYASRAHNSYNTNQNSFIQRPSINQQSDFGEQRNSGYNSGYTSNTNSARALQQRDAVNNNVASDSGSSQRYIPNSGTYNRQTDLNQDKTVKTNLESSYNQNNINIENNPSSAGGNSNAVAQNYFASNTQGLRDGPSQQVVQHGIQSPLPHPQANNGGHGTRVNSNNAGKTNYGQNQPNYYQGQSAATLQGANKKFDQNIKGNGEQSTSYPNANSNYNQVPVQYGNMKINSNYSPNMQQNANQNFATQPQTSRSEIVRNNQQYFSGNSRAFSQDPSPAHANGQNIKPTNENIGRLEQKTYDTSSYNPQPQLNNFDESYKVQNPVSINVENKNADISQVTEYTQTQQSGQKMNSHPDQKVQDIFETGRNIQSSYDSGYYTSPSNAQGPEKYLSSGVKTLTPNVRQVLQNNNQNQNLRTNAQNYGSFAGQEFRNTAFQKDQNVGLSNPTININSNEYQNAQLNYQEANVNPSYVNQGASLTSENAGRQSVASNYGPTSIQAIVHNNNNRENFPSPTKFELSFDNDRSRSKYETDEKRNALKSTNYEPVQSTATSYQNAQHNIYDSPKVNQKHETRNVLSPNFGTVSNNYKNTNYGSSETQNSVAERKPSTISNGQNANINQQYISVNNIQPTENRGTDNYSQNPTKTVNVAYSEPLDDSSAVSKEAQVEDNQEPPPEALLLVLVSAKRSAIEDYSGEEKDEMGEGYESDPEELVELLKEDSNRQMIIESFYEATNGAYRNEEETQDDLETADEITNDGKRY